MATLKQRLHRKNGSSYDTIHLETNATVVKMSTTDNTTLSTKIKNIDTEMNSVKTSVSNGKSLIASAITDKGVSTASNATFQTMANNISQIKSGVSVPVFGENFNYTGEYQILSDGNNNWRIKFLTSGTFTPLDSMAVDVFLCGGGGGGAYQYGRAGGGGFTNTQKNIVLSANVKYKITVGSRGTNGYFDRNEGARIGTAGGTSSAFNFSAAGGGVGSNGVSSSISTSGGNGGSGGCGGYNVTASVGRYSGGKDGGNGENKGGKGQGTTTREFAETTGDLYASGGDDHMHSSTWSTDTHNGNGGHYAYLGGVTSLPESGIVILRNAR